MSCAGPKGIAYVPPLVSKSLHKLTMLANIAYHLPTGRPKEPFLTPSFTKDTYTPFEAVLHETGGRIDLLVLVRKLPSSQESISP